MQIILSICLRYSVNLQLASKKTYVFYFQKLNFTLTYFVCSNSFASCYFKPLIIWLHAYLHLLIFA